MKRTLHDAENLRLGGTSDGTVVAAEGHALLVRLHILQVGDGLGQLESANGSGGLARRTGKRNSSKDCCARDMGRREGTHRVFLK